MDLFNRILESKGVNSDTVDAFLHPKYPYFGDPFLLPGMEKAVERLISALEKQEKIIIYGDYDIDGLTSVTLLHEALTCFGYKNLDIFIPNRFVEGYGLAVSSIEKIAEKKINLIVTVDCGGQSIKEVDLANQLDVDVIVTDHHSLAEVLPDAVAVINPKRNDSKYPFCELAGVGVVFKLVQALQTKLSGLDFNESKWLLDLVALGTVCDVVPLIKENRINVYWGMKVLAKTRRPGLKALMAVSGVVPEKLNARSIGFGLGPRMNASGRLETAKYALDLLMSTDFDDAYEKAEHLDLLNNKRRKEQDKILKEAIVQAENIADDSVLVLSASDWNHGVVGIVASKILEKYKKPVFVMQEMGEMAKGSARSFGDFNLAEAINDCRDILTKGGGHSVAAGISLPTKSISIFRKRINDYYQKLDLKDQQSLLLPKEDAVADFSEINEELVDLINQLEPFGNGNPQPILKTENLTVVNVKKMGADNQHLKLELKDKNNRKMQFLSFNAPEHFYLEVGEKISAWYHLDINEWQGRRTVEGKLLHIE